MVESPCRGGRPSVLESLDDLVILPGIHRAWGKEHRDRHRSFAFLYCSLGQVCLTQLTYTGKRLPWISIPQQQLNKTVLGFVLWIATERADHSYQSVGTYFIAALRNCTLTRENLL